MRAFTCTLTALTLLTSPGVADVPDRFQASYVHEAKGQLAPAVAYAALTAGVDEYYPIGGAQAVAALA